MGQQESRDLILSVSVARPARVHWFAPHHHVQPATASYLKVWNLTLPHGMDILIKKYIYTKFLTRASIHSLQLHILLLLLLFQCCELHFPLPFQMILDMLLCVNRRTCLLSTDIVLFNVYIAFVLTFVISIDATLQQTLCQRVFTFAPLHVSIDVTHHQHRDGFPTYLPGTGFLIITSTNNFSVQKGDNIRKFYVISFKKNL